MASIEQNNKIIALEERVTALEIALAVLASPPLSEPAMPISKASKTLTLPNKGKSTASA
jgi:hypothetical protein